MSRSCVAVGGFFDGATHPVVEGVDPPRIVGLRALVQRPGTCWFAIGRAEPGVSLHLALYGRGDAPNADGLWEYRQVGGRVDWAGFERGA